MLTAPAVAGVELDVELALGEELRVSVELTIGGGVGGGEYCMGDCVGLVSTSGEVMPAGGDPPSGTITILFACG